MKTTECKSQNWILSAQISFAFNGTKAEAIEKLKEDMEFLEEEVFTRDRTEYMITNKDIYCKAEENWTSDSGYSDVFNIIDNFQYKINNYGIHDNF